MSLNQHHTNENSQHLAEEHHEREQPLESIAVGELVGKDGMGEEVEVKTETVVSQGQPLSTQLNQGQELSQREGDYEKREVSLHDSSIKGQQPNIIQTHVELQEQQQQQSNTQKQEEQIVENTVQRVVEHVSQQIEVLGVHSHDSKVKESQTFEVITLSEQAKVDSLSANTQNISEFAQNGLQKIEESIEVKEESLVQQNQPQKENQTVAVQTQPIPRQQVEVVAAEPQARKQQVRPAVPSAVESQQFYSVIEASRQEQKVEPQISKIEQQRPNIEEQVKQQEQVEVQAQEAPAQLQGHEQPQVVEPPQTVPPQENHEVEQEEVQPILQSEVVELQQQVAIGHATQVRQSQENGEDDRVVDLNKPIDGYFGQEKVEKKEEPLFRLVQSQEILANESHQVVVQESMELKEVKEQQKIRVSESQSFSDLNYSVEAFASQDITKEPIKQAQEEIIREDIVRPSQAQEATQVKEQKVEEVLLSQPIEVVAESSSNAISEEQALLRSEPIQVLVESSGNNIASLEEDNKQEQQIEQRPSEKVEQIDEQFVAAQPNVEQKVQRVEPKVEPEQKVENTEQKKEQASGQKHEQKIEERIEQRVGEDVRHHVEHKMEEKVPQQGSLPKQGELQREAVEATHPNVAEMHEQLKKEQVEIEKKQQNIKQQKEMDPIQQPPKDPRGKGSNTSIVQRLVVPLVALAIAGGGAYIAKWNKGVSATLGGIALLITFAANR